MRTRAAVAVAAGKPLEIMEVNLEGPRKGEVLVEIKATGLCHTDEFTRLRAFFLRSLAMRAQALSLRSAKVLPALRSVIT